MPPVTDPKPSLSVPNPRAVLGLESLTTNQQQKKLYKVSRAHRHSRGIFRLSWLPNILTLETEPGLLLAQWVSHLGISLSFNERAPILCQELCYACQRAAVSTRNYEQTVAAQDRVHGDRAGRAFCGDHSKKRKCYSEGDRERLKDFKWGMMVRVMFQKATVEARFECERNQRRG